jgi:hypothetical protein
MEKAVWHTVVEPVIREHLIRKYVPKDPIDPLVLRLSAMYWLFQELVGNWRSGHRLTIDQKMKIIHLVVWNFTRLQQEHYEYASDVMYPGIVRRQGFDNPRESVPYPVDVALCETSDEEEYDTAVSDETAKQVADLMIACKEFQ